jgi:hypothetical protein
MDFSTLGKWIVIFGLGMVVLGLVLWVVGRLGLPVGGLPGDIRIERPGWSFSFPLVTCIVVSIVLTAVLNLILRFFRR